MASSPRKASDFNFISEAPPTSVRVAGPKTDEQKLKHKEEKEAFKQKFILKKKSDLKAILSNITKVYRAIIRYEKAFERLPPGAYMVFDTIDEKTNKVTAYKYDLETVRIATKRIETAVKNIDYYYKAKNTKAVKPGEAKRADRFNIITYWRSDSPLVRWIREEQFGQITIEGRTYSLADYVLFHTRTVLQEKYNEEVNPETKEALGQALADANSLKRPLYEQGLSFTAAIDDLFVLARTVGGSNGGRGLGVPDMWVQGPDNKQKLKKMGSFWNPRDSPAFVTLLNSPAQYEAVWNDVKKGYVNTPSAGDKTLNQVVAAKVEANQIRKETKEKTRRWGQDGLYETNHFKVLYNLCASKSELEVKSPVSWEFYAKPATPQQIASSPIWSTIIQLETAAITTVKKAREESRKASTTSGKRSKIGLPAGL